MAEFGTPLYRPGVLTPAGYVEYRWQIKTSQKAFLGLNWVHAGKRVRGLPSHFPQPSNINTHTEAC